MILVDPDDGFVDAWTRVRFEFPSFLGDDDRDAFARTMFGSLERAASFDWTATFAFPPGSSMPGVRVMARPSGLRDVAGLPANFGHFIFHASPFYGDASPFERGTLYELIAFANAYAYDVSAAGGGRVPFGVPFGKIGSPKTGLSLSDEVVAFAELLVPRWSFDFMLYPWTSPDDNMSWFSDGPAFREWGSVRERMATQASLDRLRLFASGASSIDDASRATSA